MPETTSKAELIKILLEDEDANKLEEEEMMHLLVQRKVSKDATSIQSEKMTFDVYPYILLNLLLSCVAAIQAPVIMMSQNRQE